MLTFSARFVRVANESGTNRLLASGGEALSPFATVELLICSGENDGQRVGAGPGFKRRWNSTACHLLCRCRQWRERCRD